MLPPKIAIIGSADPTRNITRDNPTPRFPYEPPVDTGLARQMANSIGAEIARRGLRLLVYDSDNKFIEGEAVSGFVKAANGTPGSIVVRQPQVREPKLFPEEASQGGLFERRVDTTDQWEVSFYRSIADDADGVVLIGGANSVLIAGQVAIGARVPMIALEKSGGAASAVWRSLRPEVDLPTLDEHARMAHDLTPEAVGRWVAALLDQRRRRFRVETKEIRSHALIAITMFVFALILAFAGHLLPRAQWGLPVWLLLFSTLLGGGSGAAIRMVFERRYGVGPLVTPSIMVTLGLGAMSGGLAGLLYIVSQPGDVVLTENSALRLISIVTVVAVVAGLTAEAVFRKLLGVDVVRTQALAVAESTPARTP
jgi:hypothetical protein